LEENNMNTRITKLFVAIAMALSFLTVARTFAQVPKEQEAQHHHYKLVIVGPLGGPNSGLSGPNFQILNDRGEFAAYADTSISNPNPDCFVPLNAPNCSAVHPLELHHGVVTDLGVLPGGANAQTTSISNNGTVLGFSDNGLIDPQTGQPEGVAVLWADGKIVSLGFLPGGAESVPVSINNRGHVVGASTNDVPDDLSILGFPTQTRAFLWRNGVIKDLGTLGGPDAFATFVNDRGQVTGFSYLDSNVDSNTGSPTTHPFLWQDGKMTDLGSLGGTLGFISFNTLGGMNKQGQIVGGSNLAGDLTAHPFLWTKTGGMQDLGTVGGMFGYANWINDAGEIVGIATNADEFLRGFLWKNGVMTDLGVIGSDPNSEAKSVNSHGQVVGSSFDCCGGDLHGFLWENGGPIVDLNTLVPPGSGLTIVNAFDINDRGEIAGNGVRSNGEERAVLLIPCDDNHADAQDCDFDDVETATAVQVPPAQITQPSAASSYAKLSPAERTARLRSILANRNRRFGALTPK
jgi:probable HAF family extracellular repeat protein